MPASLAPVGAGTLANNNNGTFDFTPAPNFNGNATFSYTVDDSNGATSNPATVTITVTPVNDAPTFTAARPDPTGLEDAAAQTVVDLLTGSDQGAANESAQKLTLVGLEQQPRSVLGGAPSIDLVTGDLTYTPAPTPTVLQS